MDKQIRNITISIICTTSLIFGQFNLQHHYDIGRDIQTSTGEFYFEDNRGSTYGFIDINYDSKNFEKKGATDAWFELARYFSTPFLNKKLNITIQYNDGIYFFPLDSISIGSPLNPAWLYGISYPFKLGNWIFPIDFLLRKQYGDDKLTYQFTSVWYQPLGTRFAFTGYIDIWTNDGSDVISIMAEPQFLFQINKFDIGIEIEVSRGFPGAWTKNESYFDEEGKGKDNKIWVIPTLFLKYSF